MHLVGSSELSVYVSEKNAASYR